MFILFSFFWRYKVKLSQPKEHSIFLGFFIFIHWMKICLNPWSMWIKICPKSNFAGGSGVLVP